MYKNFRIFILSFEVLNTITLMKKVLKIVHFVQQFNYF